MDNDFPHILTASALQSDPSVAFTYCKDFASAETKKTTWKGFAATVSNSVEYDTKKASLKRTMIIGGVRDDETKGRKENFSSRTILTLDYDDFDGISLAYIDLALELYMPPCAWVAYSTFRHTPKAPRVRIMAPLSRQVTRAEYEVIVDCVVASLDLGKVDDCSKTVGQGMFMASHQRGVTSWSAQGGSGVLDVDALGLIITAVPENAAAEAGVFELETAIAAEPLDISDKRVSRTLKSLPASSLDYDGWYKVGMALAHQYQKSEVGFKLWRNWSKLDEVGYEKLKPNELRTKWLSFGGSAKPTTMATVIKWANDNESGEGRSNALATQIDEQLTSIVPGLPPVDPKRIDAILGGVIWSGAKSKWMFLNRDGGLVFFLKAEGWRHICRRYGNPMDLGAITDAVKAMEPKEAEATIKAVKAAVRSPIEAELMYNNQRERLEWRVDPFTNESRVELGDVTARFFLTHKPYQVSETSVDQAVIADFREHFPQFDRLLYWIAACRFADDRKKSFLWMYASSDFGKGLIFSLLKELGGVVEMSVKEIEAAFEGKPLAKGPEDFRRAWILWVDEFKTVKSELKMLQSEMSVSPKFGLQSSVELFAKVFTSAESVASLAGDNGVEAQFANRMSLFECTGAVVDRPLFQSTPEYAASLRNHMALTLNRHCAKFVAMGQRRAAAKARDELNAFADEFGIAKTFGNLDENLAGLAEEFRAWLLDQAASGYGNKQILRRSTDEALYLTSPSKVLGDWLIERLDHGEAAAVGRRRPDILKALCVEGKGREVYTVSGRSIKGVQFR